MFNIGKSLALTGLVFASGCMSSTPIKRYEHSKNFYSEIAARGTFKISQSQSDLNVKNRSISVHPADTGGGRFAGRGVTLKNPKDVESQYLADLKAGLEASTGHNRFRIKAGIDGSLDTGFYYSRMKRQPLSIEEGYLSYGGFTFAKEQGASLEPFIGAELNIGKTHLFGEYSQPYAEYSHEFFDHRWGYKQVFQTDSWKGRGESYTGGIGMYFPKEKASIFLAYTEETYKPKINDLEEEVKEKAIRIGVKGEF